jgi:hypothetical protein
VQRRIFGESLVAGLGREVICRKILSPNRGNARHFRLTFPRAARILKSFANTAFVG